MKLNRYRSPVKYVRSIKQESHLKSEIIMGYCMRHRLSHIAHTAVDFSKRIIKIIPCDRGKV